MALAALVGFMLVIGGWLYSARGVVGGMFSYVTGRPVVAVGGVPEVERVGIGFLVTPSPGEAPAAAGADVRSTERPPAPYCEVRIDLCTVDAVRAAGRNTDCVVVCGGGDL